MSVFCIHCNSTGVLFIAAYISANQWGKEVTCPCCAARREAARQEVEQRRARNPLCRECGQDEAEFDDLCWNCQYNRM